MNENTPTTLEAIYAAGLKFLTPRTLEDTYTIIVNEAIQLVGGADGRLLIKEKSRFKTVYATASIRTFVKSPRKHGFTYKAFKEKQPIVINYETLTKVHPEITQQGIHSTVFIPLSYEETTIGVLHVRARRKRNFTKHKLAALKLFGSLASLAIRKTHLYIKTKEALETRDLFINMAAHELRTPLTSIKIYADLLKKNIPTNNEKLTNWAHQMQGDVNRLSHLVNELLQVQNVRKGNFSYTMGAHNIQDILESAYNDVKAAFPHHAFLIKNTVTSSDDIIFGDFDKLVQVFINVLSNAAKFSLPTNPITTTVSASSKHVTISIADKGKGIPHKELTKIFDKFYKGEQNFEEGMGIGLFLTQKIIAAHKGTITATSQLHQGTTITIRLLKRIYEDRNAPTTPT